MFPARDMSSFAPCRYNNVCPCYAEAAKRANKKISSRTVGTDVVDLVIHVVQQLQVDELCVGKIAGHR